MAEIAKVIRTPIVRLSYPNLMTPRAFEDRKKKIKGDPRYTTDLLITDTDLDKFEIKVGDTNEFKTVNLKKLLADTAREMWGEKFQVGEAVKHGGLKWPILNGTAIADKRAAEGKKLADVTRGLHVIRTGSNEEYAPQLLMLVDRKAVELDRESPSDAAKIKKLFVGGMYVVAGLKLKPNETPQGKFLNMYINSVLYVKPGDRIGGGAGEEFFAGIDGGESDIDPTDGVDDMPDVDI